MNSYFYCISIEKKIPVPFNNSFSGKNLVENQCINKNLHTILSNFNYNSLLLRHKVINSRFQAILYQKKL